MGRNCNITPLLRIESQNRSSVHVMFGDFVVCIIEVVVHPIVFTLFFWVVLGGVRFFDRDACWARVGAFGRTRDGWGESGRRMLGGRGVDAWPLRRSLPRRVIVPIRSSSAAGVIKVVTLKRIQLKNTV